LKQKENGKRGGWKKWGKTNISNLTPNVWKWVLKETLNPDG